MNQARYFLSREDGAIAVIFALLLAAIAGMLALSIEITRSWNLQTELQHAVDSAAIAGASQLDNEAGSIARARAAAQSSLAQNSQRFADVTGVGTISYASDPMTLIRFLETPTGPYTEVDADANYIEVTAPPSTIGFAFSQLVGGPSGATPAARAMAGLGAAYCRVPPLFVCRPADDDMSPGRGIWLKGKNNGDTTSWTDGDFGLLALPQFDGNSSLSAQLITDALGRVNPIAQCFGDEGVETKPGQTTSIANGINMRFNIYPTGNHQVPPGEPPVQQNWQYHPSRDTVKGLRKNGGQCSISVNGWGKPANVFVDPSTPPADIDAMGFPRDSCAYSGGTCDVPNGGSRYGDGVWAIDTYLWVNHENLINTTYGGDVGALKTAIRADAQSQGYEVTDPSGLLSRWEVYQWETMNDLVPSGAGMPEPNADTVQDPTCYNFNADNNALSGPDPTAKDRRLLTVAVVDCDGPPPLGGGQISVEAWRIDYYDLFITEPVGVWGTPADNKSIYVEIVGPSSDAGLQAEIARYILQLVE